MSSNSQGGGRDQGFSGRAENAIFLRSPFMFSRKKSLTLQTEASSGCSVALGAVWVHPEVVAVAGDALHLRVPPEVLLALVTLPPTETRPQQIWLDFGKVYETDCTKRLNLLEVALFSDQLNLLYTYIYNVSIHYTCILTSIYLDHVKVLLHWEVRKMNLWLYYI